MYEIIYYETARGDQPVALFLDELQKKVRAKVFRYLADLLAVHGPNLKRPFADVVRGKIRELRVRFASDSVRVLYFFAGREIVLLHGILKKTQELSSADIETAERRMNDWLQRRPR
ncbi:MAG: type II toxin-antitoxin system RelE/ParE family toxin [Elusimicrobia bacterium]|nr:type II toxin-antitoxin system RelE/ParE family toxin [Elusimicrobiota bacterium]MBP9127573.1 type II toxin-antitoxin system RelE/ParE family toxin [Elusimicrobiota bacterium]